MMFFKMAFHEIIIFCALDGHTANLAERKFEKLKQNFPPILILMVK